VYERIGFAGRDCVKCSIKIVLQGVLLCGLISLWGGCATNKSEKRSESLPAFQGKGQAPGAVAPLEENDRSIGTNAASQAAPGQEQSPTMAERPLGEKTADLLASAAEVVAANPDKAQRYINQAIDGDSRCYQCFYDLGVLRESEGKFTEAMKAYRKALGIYPAHPATVINISNMYLRGTQVDDAKTVVLSAINIAPKDLSLRNQLTVVLIASRRLDEAAEQAKGILAIDERDVWARINLAQVYYEQGKNELAERILVKAQEFDKNNPVIANRLGFVYLKLDDMVSATAAFKKAVELDPNQAESQNNLGVMLLRAHDYTGAAEAFRKAVALAPQFIEAYLNLGNALRGDKSFKEAEESYRQVLKLRSTEGRALFNLGLLYLDDEIPGYEKTQRLALAVENLENSEKILGKSERLNRYLDEARKKHERSVKDDLRRKKSEEEAIRKKAEAEAKAKAEAEEKVRAEAEANAKAEADEKTKAEAAVKAQADAEKAKTEAATKPKTEVKAKTVSGEKEGTVSGSKVKGK
jgi:Flp pilus assembly protein TadD